MADYGSWQRSWPPWRSCRRPPSSGTVHPVTARELPYTYRAGLSGRPAQLRLLRLSYWGFDGRPRVGSLVVRDRVARDVVTVFRRLYAARFPIRRLRKVDAYRGSDDASMAADNTSGFNCRFVSGTRRWSQHAYGEAIDVNPVENPYVQGARVSPPAGRRYLDRSRARPGMAVSGGAAGARVRGGRLEVGRPLERLAATTSTSRPPVAERSRARATSRDPAGRRSPTTSG